MYLFYWHVVFFFSRKTFPTVRKKGPIFSCRSFNKCGLSARWFSEKKSSTDDDDTNWFYFRQFLDYVLGYKIRGNITGKFTTSSLGIISFFFLKIFFETVKILTLSFRFLRAAVKYFAYSQRSLKVCS